VERAKEAMAEAEAQIDERKAVLTAAKSDFERGQQLIDKAVITQQAFDQRRRNYEGAEANIQGAIAQRDEADAAIKSALAEVQRLDASKFYKALREEPFAYHGMLLGRELPG
jgi:multidrug resistance efflux pump